MTIRVIRPADEEFPEGLQHVTPPVEKLWAIGKDLREVGPMVAIVGTRTPTPYGLEVAYGLGSDLASTGVCVVSGMARGIDGAAHEGALNADGQTIAVLGSGVDVPYPRRNAALYEKIARRGTIISEQALGSPPYPKHFPLRNRIIAGMTLGVVLVQADDHTSGAMITARHAVDMGKELFCVPGDIKSAGSWGPHDLLRRGLGHLCCSVGDIQTVLGDRFGWSRSAHGWLEPPGIGDDERAVLTVLGSGSARADQVARLSRLDAVACGRALGALEIKGVIARAQTGGYRRLR